MKSFPVSNKLKNQKGQMLIVLIVGILIVASIFFVGGFKYKPYEIPPQPSEDVDVASPDDAVIINSTGSSGLSSGLLEE